MSLYNFDLKKRNISDYVDNTELEYRDILVIKNPQEVNAFTLDREFFKLDDPDVVPYDDILEYNPHDEVDGCSLQFEFEGQKYFDQVDEEEDVTTIYGKAKLINQDKSETPVKGLLFIAL